VGEEGFKYAQDNLNTFLKMVAMIEKKSQSLVLESEEILKKCS